MNLCYPACQSLSQKDLGLDGRRIRVQRLIQLYGRTFVDMVLNVHLKVQCVGFCGT